MKKSVAIVMTALSAAASLCAAPLSASACYNNHRDIHACISLFDSEAGTIMNQDITVYEVDGDGRLTYIDALISAEHEYNPVSAYGYSRTSVSGSPAKTGEIFGVPGAYSVYLTNGSNGTSYGLNPGDCIENIDLEHSDWDCIHVRPYISDHSLYKIEWPMWNDIAEENIFFEDDEIRLHAVCYPAGLNCPAPASNARIIIDGQETDYVADMNGYVTIKMTEGGSHTLTASFPNMTDDAVISAPAKYRVIMNNEFENSEQFYQAPAENTAETTVTAAQTTVTTETTTTAFQMTTQTTVPAPVQTSFTAASSATTAITTTTAATTAATAPAANKPSSDTQKVGSLKTGDGTPILALLFAGLAAAGTAVTVTGKRKEN